MFGRRITLAAFLLANIAVGMSVPAAAQMSGKSADAMTMDEFEQAIDIVSVCIDEVEIRAPDVPGLLTRERKRPQRVALTELLEDLKLYRNQRRERERRAAQRGN